MFTKCDMKYLVPVLYLLLLAGVYLDTACAIQAQLNCVSENPAHHISSSEAEGHVITVNRSETTMARVNCTIDCTNIDLNNCSMEANAYIIVPSNDYSTYKVCPRNTGSDFNGANYGVNASCSIESRADICVNKAEEVYTVTLSDLHLTAHKEFVIICGFTPSTIVVHNKMNELEPVLSLAVNGLHERRGKVIIRIQDIEVFSDQIDRHPALEVDEGGNVTLTCAKTYGSIGVWKFVLNENQSLVEIVYSMDDAIDHSQLQLRGISVNASESISSVDGLQNFSITISDVPVSLTSTALFCGAREIGEGGTQLQEKFYSQAAVLVVHKVTIGETNDTKTPVLSQTESLNAGEKAGISLGVISVSVIIVITFVLFLHFGGHIQLIRWSPNNRVHNHPSSGD